MCKNCEMNQEAARLLTTTNETLDQTLLCSLNPLI